MGKIPKAPEDIFSGFADDVKKSRLIIS